MTVFELFVVELLLELDSELLDELEPSCFAQEVIIRIHSKPKPTYIKKDLIIQKLSCSIIIDKVSSHPEKERDYRNFDYNSRSTIITFFSNSGGLLETATDTLWK